MNENKKRDYFWNTFAGLINAAEAVVMSIFVTRYGRLSDAGVLSLAFAIGNVLMTIGKFGVRMYQVTDAKKQFSFRMYLIQRAITCSLMVASLVAVLLVGKYSTNKAKSIILITSYYLIECLEDCIWGYYQAQNRLYVGAMMFSTRWLVILFSFCILIVITGNLNYALLFSFMLSAVIFLLWIVVLQNREKRDDFENIEILKKTTNDSKWLYSLFKQTVPLFGAGFCSILISNIPKFAIDRHMNDEIQACYGFVAMPVFVIGLLNQFIYQPTVVHLTNEFQKGDIIAFYKDARRNMLSVIIIAAACILGAGFIGVPVLSLIYHTDLKGYWKELVVLQFAGSFLALSGYLTVLLTLMRKQKIILVGYVVATVLGIIILDLTVQIKGTMGASIGYLLVMFILFLFYYFSYHNIIAREKRNR